MYCLQVEVVESLAEGLDQIEADLDHDDQRSEHSDQEQDNPPPDHDDGKHIDHFEINVDRENRKCFCPVRPFVIYCMNTEPATSLKVPNMVLEI